MHRVAVTGVTLALILACSVVSAGSLDRRRAQTTGATQTVTGTVKTTTDGGIVVVGRDTGILTESGPLSWMPPPESLGVKPASPGISGRVIRSR